MIYCKVHSPRFLDEDGQPKLRSYRIYKKASQKPIEVYSVTQNRLFTQEHTRELGFRALTYYRRKDTPASKRMIVEIITKEEYDQDMFILKI